MSELIIPKQQHKQRLKRHLQICLQNEQQKMAIQELARKHYVTSSELLRAVCMLMIDGKIKFSETEIIKILKQG